MRTYNKRIAFLISDQHFIPHGGIGSFCKGFTEMCDRLNWKVDILLDKAPNNNNFKEIPKLETLDHLKYLDLKDNYIDPKLQDMKNLNFEFKINF